MDDHSPLYGGGMTIVTLCRILKPRNWQTCSEFEPPVGGASSSMKVAVPKEVMMMTAETGNLELLDLWVEDEFGFPWVLAHGENMNFMSPESYKVWCNEI